MARGTLTSATHHAEAKVPESAALGGGRGKRGVRNYFDGGQPYIPASIVEYLVVIGHAASHVRSACQAANGTKQSLGI